MELEAISRQAGLDPNGNRAYPFAIRENEAAHVVHLEDTWAAIMDEIERGTPVAQIGRRFHATLAALVLAMCQRLREEAGLNAVALSGGCFQNRLLLEMTIAALEGAGFGVLTHGQVPCNDGGVALGQAMAAGWLARP